MLFVTAVRWRRKTMQRLHPRSGRSASRGGIPDGPAGARVNTGTRLFGHNILKTCHLDFARVSATPIPGDIPPTAPRTALRTFRLIADKAVPVANRIAAAPAVSPTLCPLVPAAALPRALLAALAVARKGPLLTPSPAAPGRRFPSDVSPAKPRLHRDVPRPNSKRARLAADPGNPCCQSSLLSSAQAVTACLLPSSPQASQHLSDTSAHASAVVTV